MAVKYSITVNTLENIKSKTIEEVISIIPVNIQYFLGENWKLQNKKGEQINLKYEYKNENAEITYKLYDYRRIISITLTRKKDIDRAVNFYTP